MSASNTFLTDMGYRKLYKLTPSDIGEILYLGKNHLENTGMIQVHEILHLT